MSIEILSQDVQNQIAAGEVVERPAHMVKELVENSLDAGATKIEINFSEGGRSLKLTDNGHGITKQDLPKAIMRFATSKISRTDDLWKLNTYGFRGEALASIAAVSNLRIRSKSRSEDQSFQMKFEFGLANEIEQTQSDFGTTLIIDSLFENVPARLKFLKSEAAEHTQIKNTIKAMALSHPEVEFRVLEDNDLVYFWPASSSRRERVEQVLGIKSLYEGSAERDGVKAFAVMSSPADVQKTSRNIWLFVQNRWVQDRSLQAAVIEAYRNLLMHGEFPQAVVWVETASDEIDVNIHPTKSQVKFKDPSLAFRAVQASLRNTLEQAPWLQTHPRDSENSNSELMEFDQIKENIKQSVESYSQHENKQSGFDFTTQSQYQQKSWIRNLARDQQDKSHSEQSWLAHNQQGLNQQQQMPNLNQLQTQLQDNNTTYDSRGYWSQLQIIGQVNLTYIVAQNKNKMILIDQHAAHERVVFEKLMSSWKSGNFDIQEYLFPLSVELSADRCESLLQESENLQKMGLEVERLGPQTVGIKSGPTILNDSALRASLEILSTEILENGGSFSFEKKIADIFASMACHSVVRAGQALSPEQMKSLLDSMDEFPLSCYCPHGRPVSLEFNFLQLEKDFGRRV